jgi:hypothetical protein
MESFSSCAFFDRAKFASCRFVEAKEGEERCIFEWPLVADVLERRLPLPELAPSEKRGRGGGEDVIRIVPRGEDEDEEVRNGERLWRG